MHTFFLAKEPSLQIFNTSVENGKGSRNAGAASSLVAGGGCLVPKNGHEPVRLELKLSEGGMLLSQELARSDSEGEVTAKKPVALSDSEDGLSQMVAIKSKRAQNVTIVQASHQKKIKEQCY
jgi:hypothetical protein